MHLTQTDTFVTTLGALARLPLDERSDGASSPGALTKSEGDGTVPVNCCNKCPLVPSSRDPELADTLVTRSSLIRDDVNRSLNFQLLLTT